MLLPHRGRLPLVAPTAFVETSAMVIGDVVIGEHSSVWFNVVIRGDVNSIRIGDRSNVQDGTVVHVARQTHRTVIGDDVTIGHNVTLHGCTVGDRCLVGMGSVILDGVTIESDAMVAAGSVVLPGAIIPSRTLAMGAPAQVRRRLTDDEVVRLAQSASNYIEYMQEYK